MRFLYSLVLLLLLPPVFSWFMWRSLRQTGHADHWGERFGSSPYLPPKEALWVHAASVGEVRAAAPLVNALHQRNPQRPIIVTCFTATGRAQAQRTFAGRVVVTQLPYDLGFCVRRWLGSVQPRLGIILETEIWPNLLHACGRARLPVLVVSARMSSRSLRRYRRSRGLMRRALAGVRIIAAQTAADAECFQQIGVPAARLQVAGNLKFDVEFTASLAAEGAALRTRLFGECTVIVAGSTHEHEERQVLEAFRALLATQPKCVLVLAPRHPERAPAVAALALALGFTVIRRSAGEAVMRAGSVLLLDSLGELTRFYAAGDIAFVGGSLVPIGGHNLLEPAALGLPVISGPQLANVSDIATLLKDAGGLTVVSDASVLARAFTWLAADSGTRRRIGQAAAQIVSANRGTLGRVLALVEQTLAES
ncbi:MAG: lipid IV(A) 3-deoxy-D-manno-octulosonic acid transferase [Gammaproteobacteria bacterium]